MNITETNINNGTSQQCAQFVELGQLVYFILPASVFILVFLSLVEKKVLIFEERNCCGRRPSTVIPVNLLDGDENRLVYAAAFGCASTSVFGIILNPSYSQLGYSVPGYLLYLYTLMVSLIIGLVYYPLFLCLYGRCPFLHPIIGVLYAAVWFIVHIIQLIPCEDPTVLDTVWMNIIISVPAMLCLFLVIIRFIYMLAMDIKHSAGMCRKQTIRMNGESTALRFDQERIRLARPHHLQHVRNLISGHHILDGEGEYGLTILHKVKLNYKGKSSFRYSPRLTATFFVASLCLYQIFGLVCYLSIAGSVKLEDILVSHKKDIRKISPTLYNQLHILFDTASICHYVAFGIATLVILFYIWKIFVSYRKNIMQMYRGDFSNVPKSVLNQTPAEIIFLKSFMMCFMLMEILAHSVHYSGSQIAYLIWSYLLQYIVLFVAFMLLAYLAILPILGVVSDVFLTTMYTILSGFFTSQLFYYSQLLVSKKLLLQKEEVFNPVTNNTGQILALRNRKLYHNVSYLLFFFYIFLGFYKCIVRILKAVVLGVLFFGRLDKTTLIVGYETWDTGYMAYMSFLQMELVHCHPVVVVFCDALLEDQHRKVELQYRTNVPLRNQCNTSSEVQTSLNSVERMPGTMEIRNPMMIYNRTIRNKWLKIYTLINNPTLRNNLEIEI